MPAIHRVTTLDLPVEDYRWPFAAARRAEIDAYFSQLTAANPALWNGQILLAREPRIVGNTFTAHYFQTDFASFIAWRDWGFPDPSVINGFGMGALRGSDGGFILGEMAAQTSNAGKVYFPSGTPDLNDVANGRLDIAASVAREVAEEVGLAPSDYTANAVWHCILAGPLVAMIRVLDAPVTADLLRDRIATSLAEQHEPELGAVHIVRGPGDITAAMPAFVVTFLAAQFEQSGATHLARRPGAR